MKTPRSGILVELVCTVLSVSTIYGTIWLSGFQDTPRRWTLFVCLFGIWFSFILGRSVAARAVAPCIGGDSMPGDEPPRRNRVWGMAGSVGMMVVMLVVGLVLRLTA